MIINELLEQKHMTKYKLAQSSKVPYTTLNDLCNGKTSISKCNAETVFRLAKALQVSMEDLFETTTQKRGSFENFKSSVCHRIKETGDLAFITEILETCEIQTYYDRKWYPESLYLLAMLDYLSRINDVPLCEDYNDLRKLKLSDTIYPAGIVAMSLASNSDEPKLNAQREAIPEFIRFNIVENNIRDVC